MNQPQYKYEQYFHEHDNTVSNHTQDIALLMKPFQKRKLTAMVRWSAEVAGCKIQNTHYLSE